MSKEVSDWQLTEQNSGRVEAAATAGATADRLGWRLTLEPNERGYSNAQVDDYSFPNGLRFRWTPPTSFQLRARFSGEADTLVGTAGFGFWNAPFGPGTGYRLRLPRAAWFFYAAESSDLPLAPLDVRGNGWFASTIDASGPGALLWAPFALPVLLLNQVRALRRRLWPMLRRDLKISFEHISHDMAAWHDYRLSWRSSGTSFLVDGQPIFQTRASPGGPLGFVSWIDNQYVEATPRGRVRWGTNVVARKQWLEIASIKFDPDA